MATLPTPGQLNYGATLNAWLLAEHNVDGTHDFAAVDFSEINAMDLVNVKAHGATGLGVADEHDSFAAAVAAAGVGGTVVVPPGTYLFDSAFDLRLAGGTVRLVGFGPASVLKASSSNSDAIIKTTDGMNPIYLDGLRFRSANTSATAISGPTDHYITGLIQNCDFYPEFATAVDGFLGDIKFSRCDFGYFGSAIPNCQAIKHAGYDTNYQGLNIQFEHCKFFNYQGNLNGAIEMNYVNTCEFRHCIFESLSLVPIYATAVANLLLHKCCFELNDPSTGGGADCLIHGLYRAAVGTGTHCFMTHCRFTNSHASDPWDHVFYASDTGCWMDIRHSRGGLSTTYWCKDSGGNYDVNQALSSRGLIKAEDNQVTGYAGGSFFPGLSHIGTWDKSFASPSHDYSAGTTAWTMTELEAAANFFTVTNAGGAADAVFPRAVPGKRFVVYNNSGAAITFKVTGQTGSAVATGKYATFIMNATDCVEIYEQP